jgi:Icc-related predicted phosphoesterase
MIEGPWEGGGSQMLCFFVTDLHGKEDRYSRLFKAVSSERPDAVFLGGDLFPRHTDIAPFMEKELFRRIRDLKVDAEIFAIMGNDDRRSFEDLFINADDEGILHYVNSKKVHFGDFFVRGYSYVPPSPFRLKDWEKRDVPGKVPYLSIPPEEGITTIPRERPEMIGSSIQEDLRSIQGDPDLSRTLFLFHAPPYNTCLDKVGYEAPRFDPHVGSRSIREFIGTTQPMITMHGHIHESISLTGCFKERIGSTLVIGSAHEGVGLSLVRFDPLDLDDASRKII